jgi:hypothetical protein
MSDYMIAICNLFFFLSACAEINSFMMEAQEYLYAEILGLSSISGSSSIAA